ncbi:hypothetical protein QUD96_25555 [Klebsiella pneumoniae]|nr:hypothetical protein [Klebsiella pneumoniae]MDM7347678.1 hypothetical protein [Klebsiella pneumoniae]
MTTKRQAQRAAESDLQAFLNEAADRVNQTPHYWQRGSKPPSNATK